jgi:hypothetical protein
MPCSLLPAVFSIFYPISDWERLLQVTYFPKESVHVRTDSNYGSTPKVVDGYEGEATQENECEGSAVQIAWHQRLQLLYGPTLVTLRCSSQPNFTVPPLKGRVHTVEWYGDFFGEVWFRNGAQFQLTGDPEQDWPIIEGLMTSENFAVRVDRIWRGVNQIKFVGLAQPPSPGGNGEPNEGDLDRAPLHLAGAGLSERPPIGRARPSARGRGEPERPARDF